MTQNEFIDLIHKVFIEVSPFKEARKQYIEQQFKKLNYSNSIGYQSMQYYYSQLENALKGEESIFKGSVHKNIDNWAIVGELKGKPYYCCYFKMKYETFESLKELIGTQRISIDFPNYLKHDKPEQLAQKLKDKFKDLEKGKEYAFMIYCLRDYIDIPIEKKAFYKSMAEYFEKDIGTESSINRFLGKNFENRLINENDFTYKEIKAKTDKIISSLKIDA